MSADPVRLRHLCAVLNDAPTPAWAGESDLDPEPRCLARVEVFQIGDRIIAPATPSAVDPAYRDGGHGEVVGVREDTASGEPFAYVVLDESADAPQPFRFDELRREPTV